MSLHCEAPPALVCFGCKLVVNHGGRSMGGIVVPLPSMTRLDRRPKCTDKRQQRRNVTAPKCVLQVHTHTPVRPMPNHPPLPSVQCRMSLTSPARNPGRRETGSSTSEYTLLAKLHVYVRTCQQGPLAFVLTGPLQNLKGNHSSRASPAVQQDLYGNLSAFRHKAKHLKGCTQHRAPLQVPPAPELCSSAKAGPEWHFRSCGIWVSTALAGSF